MENFIHITLAETELEIGLIYPDTSKAFQRFFSDVPISHDFSIVHVKDSDKDDWEVTGSRVFDEHAEYSSLSIGVSEELLKSNRFVMHAVAFIWKDKAWLLSGTSGIGKSTQFKNLSVLFPEEIQIISGDRPVLRIMDDGTVYVYPSPWNGKEDWWGTKSAPLAGIFFLEHGENAMMEMDKDRASVALFTSIFQSFNTKEVIQKVALVATRLLSSCDCWLLVNRGDYASTELIYETMKQWNSKE